VGIVPFTDAVYASCDAAPSGCLTVGGVDYRYGIGQLEVTIDQWVTFLNTVDPTGKRPRGLYDPSESSAAWPKYGQITLDPRAGRGRHYSAAFPQWLNKPYGFANFPRAARFANAVENGRILSRRTVPADGFTYTEYRIRLSRRTQNGMYDLGREARTGATRSSRAGFVIPSQDEWIKAAYFDPKGGGTHSYWKYPTNAGVFGDGTDTAPASTTLDPATGDVTNATTQPLANFHASGQAAPTWCPAQVQPQSDCTSVNPFGIDPLTYASLYQGSLGSVAQAGTLSPWGTLDQGGNAVEWTDTITASPRGSGGRVFRRLHGGVPNAPAYQLWLSAVGLQPQDNAFFEHTYPWLGFRLGFIGQPR